MLTLVLVLACGGATAQPVAVAQPRVVATPHEDPDRDHDGIPNECDACPDEPENYNGICDEDGCPDKCTLPVGGGVVALSPVLLFGKQSSKLSTLAQPLADDVINTMVKHSDVLDLVAIVGHASRDEADGEALALARATTVKQSLVAGGVDAGHLVVHAVGTRDPSDDKDEALNRRVSFVVLRAEGREQFRVHGDAIEAVASEAHESAGPQCAPTPATCHR